LARRVSIRGAQDVVKPSRASIEQKFQRWNHRFVGTLSLLLLLLPFLGVYCFARPLNHDEEQFVASGALLARGGLFPYLDYPYFHLPNLVFVYAVLFSTNDFLLLTARCFNVACAALLLLLFFSLLLSAFRFLGERRWSVAAALTLLLALNPLFRLTTGRAWNHDLPMLASVAAFAALLRGLQGEGSDKWIAAAGALLGVAVGTRLTFLPLIIPFVVLTWMFRPTETRSYRGTVIFLTTLSLALLPTLVLFAADPRAFCFDNFTINGALNLRFRHADVPEDSFLRAKLLFPWQKLLLRSPSNLLLVAGFGFFACWLPFRGGWRKVAGSPQSAAILLIIPFALLGALLPTPSYRQYYYLVVPFLFLGIAFGMAQFWQAGGRSNKMVWIFTAALLVSLIELVPDLHGSGVLAPPNRWAVWTVHKIGREIRQRAGPGPVLTLAPIYPLEGGAGIYQEFCTGPFAWRLSQFAEEKDQARYKLIDPDQLDRYLTRKPTAILTGVEKKSSLEKPFVEYARRNRYSKTSLPGGEVLWLPPVETDS
jgi:hypothetical protein